MHCTVTEQWRAVVCQLGHLITRTKLRMVILIWLKPAKPVHRNRGSPAQPVKEARDEPTLSGEAGPAIRLAG